MAKQKAKKDATMAEEEEKRTTGGNRRLVIASIVGGSLAIFLGMAFSFDENNPYYYPSTSNLFIPLSLIYTTLAHSWRFCMNGGKLPEPTPLPPSNEKRVALITGSNTGIGLEASRTLVQDYGWNVILGCRSKDKAIKAQEDINNSLDGKASVMDFNLDLSDFRSIKRFVQELSEKYDKIDVVINNAGRNTSGKGQGNLDLMFQSNYLGHFYLTKLLLEAGLLQEDSKIINVSSVMHHFCEDPHYDIDEIEYWKSRAVVGYEGSDKMPDGVYSATKLAAILHCVEWNQHYPYIPCMAVNPGAVNSDIWRGFPDWMRAIFAKVYLTTNQGSAPLVAAAVKDKWGTSSGVTYLQPYWIPSLSSSEEQSISSPMIPFTEMLGPYVGYVSTPPRLPSDGGKEAAKMLWQVSEVLLLINQNSQ